jgi:hypothetical protein
MRMPFAAQLSCIYAIEFVDLDKDGKDEMLLGGNLYGSKPEMGRYDASYGAVVDYANGELVAYSSEGLGLSLDGEVREILKMEREGDYQLVIANNNDRAQVYKPINN